MSGYELSAFADRSVAYFWPISRSLVYRETARLERLGLVRGTDVVQERLPDKRVYEVTDEGMRALERWLATTPFEPDRGRSSFLLMFFFGERMPASRVRELVREYRGAAERDIEDLSAIVEHLEGVPQARFGYLSARLGVHVARARLAWADEVEATLTETTSGEPPTDARHRT